MIRYITHLSQIINDWLSFVWSSATTLFEVIDSFYLNHAMVEQDIHARLRTCFWLSWKVEILWMGSKNLFSKLGVKSHTWLIHDLTINTFIVCECLSINSSYFSFETFLGLFFFSVWSSKLNAVRSLQSKLSNIIAKWKLIYKKS